MHHMTKQRFIAHLHIGNRNKVPPGNNHIVNWRRWTNVTNDNNILCFVQDLGGHLFIYDFAKNTIHYFFVFNFAFSFSISFSSVTVSCTPSFMSRTITVLSTASFCPIINANNAPTFAAIFNCVLRLSRESDASARMPARRSLSINTKLFFLAAGPRSEER